MKNQTISKIVKIAMFSSLSFLLFYLKFPILPSFSFLEIQFSNLPAILAGFALGPVSGCIVVVIRTLLKFLFIGSSTGGVGELADFLIGIFVVLTTSLIYLKHKTKKGGIISLIFGCVVWIVSALILNWLVLAPLYGLEKDIIPYYLFAGVLPFNAILSILVSLISFVVYKSISNLINKF